MVTDNAEKESGRKRFFLDLVNKYIPVRARRFVLFGIIIVIVCLLFILSDKENHEVIRTFVYLLAALIGFYFTIERLNISDKQVKINQRGFFNDRFGRGAELLNNENIYMRTLGIRLLGDLHKDADETNQKLIRKLILNFIHDRTGLYNEKLFEGVIQQSFKKREDEDIEAAIRILGDLVPKDTRGQELNMSQYNLQSLDLSYAKLQGADLWGAKLQRVYLKGAKLQGARLSFAHLQSAILLQAKLQGAHLKGAKLQGASLQEADLRDAKLDEANLTYTDLTEADLEGIKNLTQEQLDKGIYEKDRPPKGLAISEERAYTWQIDENGNRRRKFVHNGERVGPFVGKGQL